MRIGIDKAFLAASYAACDFIGFACLNHIDCDTPSALGSSAGIIVDVATGIGAYLAVSAAVNFVGGVQVDIEPGIAEDESAIGWMNLAFFLPLA